MNQFALMLAWAQATSCGHGKADLGCARAESKQAPMVAVSRTANTPCGPAVALILMRRQAEVMGQRNSTADSGIERFVRPWIERRTMGALLNRRESIRRCSQGPLLCGPRKSPGPRSATLERRHIAHEHRSSCSRPPLTCHRHLMVNHPAWRGIVDSASTLSA